MNDCPVSNIDSPKAEEDAVLVKHKSIAVAGGREFMSELDERLASSTEGNQPSTGNKDETDSALRSELNINSPKESMGKKILFPGNEPEPS